MKIYTFRFRQNIPVGLDEAWAFFSSPFNLARITPALGFSITSNIEPDEIMYPGILISYTVRPFAGIKMSWLTEITHIREKEYFVDEQRFGPFSFWHHQHHFNEIEGGIAMEDILTYAIPYGFIGRIVNSLAVENKVLKIFKTREDKINEIFNDSAASATIKKPKNS